MNTPQITPFWQKAKTDAEALEQYARRFVCTFCPFLGLALLLLMSFMEICLAVTLEQQLQSVKTLAYGPFIRVGVGIATIAAAIIAVAKHSVGMMFMVIAAGIALSYYLGWLNSSDFITSGGGTPPPGLS